MDQAGGYAESSFVSELYDDVPLYRDRKDVDFFLTAAREAKGPVLELGCGTGRILLPTARAGFEITGLDRSPAMLGVCRRRVEGEPADVRARIGLVLGDMRQFSFRRRFHLVTAPFRAFLHLLTIEDQMAALDGIRSHLVPGGTCILDCFNPSIPYLASNATGTEFGTELEFPLRDGSRALRKFRLAGKDLLHQINDCETIYYVTRPDGRQERLVHRFPLRYLFRYEAEHLLARCGFSLDAVFSGHDRTPWGRDYPGELILVARAR